MVNHVPEPQNISKHSKAVENITQVDTNSPEILGSAFETWQSFGNICKMLFRWQRSLDVGCCNCCKCYSTSTIIVREIVPARICLQYPERQWPHFVPS